MNLIEILHKHIGELISSAILIILALDGLRIVVAALHLFPRNNSKISKLIYGDMNTRTVEAAFDALGFEKITDKELADSFRDVRIDRIKQENKHTREILMKIKSYEQCVINLISLLAEHTVYFQESVQYSKKSISNSHYYINTMEICCDEDKLHRMAVYLKYLIDSVLQASSSAAPQIIFSPKGGNPSLAKKVAELYGAHLILVKPDMDKSKISTRSDSINDLIFRVNYEGAGLIDWESEESYSSILVDCNISGGSQLVSIVQELRKLNVIDPIPTSAFVLFRADDKDNNIDQSFEEIGCKLYRFFDLNESLKEGLYKLKADNCLDIYNKKALKRITEFRDELNLKCPHKAN